MRYVFRFATKDVVALLSAGHRSQRIHFCIASHSLEPTYTCIIPWSFEPTKLRRLLVVSKTSIGRSSCSNLGTITKISNSSKTFRKGFVIGEHRFSFRGLRGFEKTHKKKKEEIVNPIVCQRWKVSKPSKASVVLPSGWLLLMLYFFFYISTVRILESDLVLSYHIWTHISSTKILTANSADLDL